MNEKLINFRITTHIQLHIYLVGIEWFCWLTWHDGYNVCLQNFVQYNVSDSCWTMENDPNYSCPPKILTFVGKTSICIRTFVYSNFHWIKCFSENNILVESLYDIYILFSFSANSSTRNIFFFLFIFCMCYTEWK